MQLSLSTEVTALLLRFKLHKSATWIFIGQILSALAMFISLRVWTEYLQPSQFGLMGLLVGFSSILAGIISSPITQATLVGYAAHSKNSMKYHFRAISYRLLIKYTMITSLCALILGFPLSLLFKIHWMTPFLIIGLFLVESRRNFELNFFAAARRQREVAILMIGDPWFRLVFIWVALLYFKPSAYSAIIGSLFGGIVFLLIARIFLAFEAHPGIVPQDDNLIASLSREIMNIAKPLFPSVILQNITEMSNRYIIGASIGLGSAGLFIVSYGLVKRPYGILSSVTDLTMRPFVCETIADCNIKRTLQARKFWLFTGTFFAVLGVPLFYLLRNLIVEVLLSPSYKSTSELLPLIAFAVMLYNISHIYDGFSLTIENSKAVLTNNIIGSFTNIILTSLFCFFFGIIGAVWALIIAYLFQLITSIYTFSCANKHNISFF